MLVLTRQRDQTVMIGDDVEVTVVDIRGDKVRIGITAPKMVSVHRKEIWEAIRRENQAAAELTPQDLVGAPPPAIVTPQFPGLASTEPTAVEPAGEFLNAAIEEAQIGLREGGLPIGAVLVRDRQIIGRGHNLRVQRGDPMAHAEIACLTNAGPQKTYRDTVIYSTVMPCFLCGGAAVQLGVPRIVAGDSVNFSGAMDFLRSRGIEVLDAHNAHCIEMLAHFAREHPEVWKEHMGN